MTNWSRNEDYYALATFPPPSVRTDSSVSTMIVKISFRINRHNFFRTHLFSKSECLEVTLLVFGVLTTLTTFPSINDIQSRRAPMGIPMILPITRHQSHHQRAVAMVDSHAKVLMVTILPGTDA
jgi:hypothetical protein